ncbi:MAG TPA: transposase [Azospirillum sp.]|nr:transposase [Azospirillum sp.]
MRYRRDRTPGGIYFFTVVTEGRAPLFSDAGLVDLLRDSFRTVRNRHPFAIDAIVVLPDHLHTIWTLPPHDDDYVTRWGLIKAEFSRRCPAALKRVTRPDRARRREVAIWQRRYWEHRIRDEGDLAAHIEYIHWNPVKHGHAAAVAEWPYSSFHSFVRRGIYPADWDTADKALVVSGPDE